MQQSAQPLQPRPDILGSLSSMALSLGLERRVLAVVLHEDVGGAVDVEIGDHHLLRLTQALIRRVTALSVCALSRLLKMHLATAGFMFWA